MKKFILALFLTMTLTPLAALADPYQQYCVNTHDSATYHVYGNGVQITDNVWGPVAQFWGFVHQVCYTMNVHLKDSNKANDDSYHISILGSVLVGSVDPKVVSFNCPDVTYSLWQPQSITADVYFDESTNQTSCKITQVAHAAPDFKQQ